MIKCNICNELKGNIPEIPIEYAGIVKSNRNVILESKDLVVLPSFGPLNNSHVMIVPREHVYNFSSISQDAANQLREIIIQLKDSFLNTYNKNLVFFESGAGSLSNHSGGCIVHAHIHCVVENEDFERSLFKEVELRKASNETTFNTTQGYIWYKSSDGQEYIKNDPLLPSQFLRYIYRQNSSTPQSWNWRRNIDIAGIQSVIDTYCKIYT